MQMRLSAPRLDKGRAACQNSAMRRLFPMMTAILLLVACAPVLNRELLREGLRDVPLDMVRAAPESYQGRLFILGGLIVETKVTEQGAQIEALAVPVNKYGHLREEIRTRDGRFLAVYPREHGFLDPVIFKKGRMVTLAGASRGTRKARVDEADYTYPLFEIRQIYLWEERPDHYYYPYSYPYSYPYPYGWYDPWWRPYPPPWYGPPRW